MARAQPPGLNGRVGILNLYRLYSNPFARFPRWRDKYGDIVRIETVYGTHYIIFHPKDVKQVLIDDFDHYSKGKVQQDIFEPVTGTQGLMLSSNEQWRQQRDLIRSSLYRDRVSGYIETMAAYAEDFVASWDEGDAIALDDEMTELSLTILGQALFGEDIRQRQGPIRAAGKMITEKYDASSTNYYLPDWLPTATNREFEEAIDTFNAEIEQMIATRKQELSQCSPEELERNDLLTDLVSIGRGDTDPRPTLPDDVLRDNMKGFVLGGQGTTPLALTYTLYLLATHSEVAKQVYEECWNTLEGSPPTIDDLDDLTYLNCVITESLRLYPPVYGLFREATKPLEIGDYDIPEGSTIILPQFAIQRDERWYENPNVFDPDRWDSTDSKSDRPDLAHFAFGGGPDSCIGEKFARAELKTVIATIIQEWNVAPITENFEQVTSITAQPKDDIFVRVWKRNGPLSDNGIGQQ